MRGARCNDTNGGYVYFCDKPEATVKHGAELGRGEG